MKNKIKDIKKEYVFSELVEDVIEFVCEDLKKLQLETGSKDSYGQGLYNGMEIIKATLLRKDPKYLDKNFVKEE